MRVLHLVPKFIPSIGGVENFVHELVNVQIKKIEVEIFTSNILNFENFQKLRIMNDFPYVKRFNAFSLFPFLPRGLGVFSFSMLRELIRREDIDIIHSHSYGYFTTYLGSFKKYLKKSKHIIQTHSDPGRRKLTKMIFDSIVPIFSLYGDKIIAISELEKNYLKSLGIEEKKIIKIPLGINLNLFRRYQKYKINDNFLLFVGRFDIDQKGIDILLKAIKISRKEFNNIKLYIIGYHSENKIKIIKMIKKLNLENEVLILGNISKEELIKYYHNCRALVLPSRFEPFGLVILEAFACSKPVIASRVGGIPEIVNEKNGILFKAEDANELAKAIIKIMKMDDDEYKNMCNEAYLTAEKFDIERISQMIIELYESLLTK
jgi:glycosyltransferase involved in cell wall biosynthesis